MTSMNSSVASWLHPLRTPELRCTHWLQHTSTIQHTVSQPRHSASTPLDFRMGGPVVQQQPAEPASAFLSKHKEKEDFNQYWYSQPTIKAIVQELLTNCTSAAFLSTPSLYFSLPTDSSLKASSWVFDYDQQWSKDPHYVWYDFHKPEDIPVHLHGTFDCCVMDPPFITEDVWQLYAAAAKVLLKPDGKVVCSTVAENAELMQRLFAAQPRTFKPSIPHLVYQYNLFTNYPPGETFNQANPEIPEDD